VLVNNEDNTISVEVDSLFSANGFVGQEAF
jgi:hypothetical protein